LDTATHRSGLADSMKQAGITRNISGIVGLIVFWLFLCVSIMTAFRVLELEVLSQAMQQVVNYIPKILVAMVVVVVGLLVASFFRGVVAASADRVGLSYGEHLASACYYVLALITLLAAAGHLGVKLELLETLILIAFGALAAGFGLALGLGGRDVVGGILAGYYVRQRFASGDRVNVSNMEGTVREVGPVATIIETEEEGLLHRHSVPNTVMLKEGVR
jgi:small-conductance mechanosensitive channel